jgi:elongation factor Ts
MITTENIKELRDQTGISVMQCKKALEETGGDMEKALLFLKRKSGEIASKKASRNLGAGTIAAYIHAGGKVGTMVELSCETDFVAKNEDFKKLAYDIAMHIAATNPSFLSTDDISEDDKKKATEMLMKEVEKTDKPEEIKKKMLEGKLSSFFNEQTLLEQPFIKNPDVTIKGLIEEAVQKFGERTEITNFARFSVSG